MLKKLTILLITTVHLISCNDPMNPNPNVILNYGTSFGHCLGYCQSTLKLSGETAILTLADIRNELPIKESSRLLTQRELNQLFSNVNWDQFQNLDSIIGCPDCADGGAEWVEIRNGADVKKVTFEYGDAPGELVDLVKTLNAITESLDYRNNKN